MPQAELPALISLGLPRFRKRWLHASRVFQRYKRIENEERQTATSERIRDGAIGGIQRRRGSVHCDMQRASILWPGGGVCCQSRKQQATDRKPPPSDTLHNCLCPGSSRPRLPYRL